MDSTPTCRYCSNYPERVCCDEAFCQFHLERHWDEEHPPEREPPTEDELTDFAMRLERYAADLAALGGS